MIITPYSVFYSIVWGSICLIFLRLVYKFLLRHNCFKLVLFFSSLVIFRFLFVIDLPVILPAGALYSISEYITLRGKEVLDFIPTFSLLLMTQSYWIKVGKLLLIVWIGIAIFLIIKDWLTIRSITNHKVTHILNDNKLAKHILQQIQEEMNTKYDIKIVQNSYIQVPFVRGIIHPIIY